MLSLVMCVLVAVLSVFGVPQLGLWGNHGCAFPGATCTRVLFLGDRFTSVNDLPAALATLA